MAQHDGSLAFPGIAIIIAASTLLLASSATWGAETGNIHQQTHACVLDFNSACDSVCLVCHPAPPSAPVNYPTPWNPQGLSIDEFYADPLAAAAKSPEVAELVDDINLCVGCHDSMARHGDHPVGIEYVAKTSKLLASPQGPKLLCAKAGSPCKLQCSTCHNPHTTDINMLRMKNQGSALCIACHVK